MNLTTPSGRRLPDAVTTENVCRFIRAGTFQWVAAVASGVSKGKYAEWMSGITPEEREFQRAVEQAYAQARAIAETKIAKEKPLAWLMRGPGRDRPGEAGWTSQVAVTGPKGGALETVLTSAANAPVEDYSGFTVEEMRQLRALRDRARQAAEAKRTADAASAEAPHGDEKV
jgi:hypothetical protein